MRPLALLLLLAACSGGGQPANESGTTIRPVPSPTGGQHEATAQERAAEGAVNQTVPR